jgi:hypothetical protein
MGSARAPRAANGALVVGIGRHGLNIRLTAKYYLREEI